MLLLSVCIVEANEKKIIKENSNKEIVANVSSVSQSEKEDFKNMRLKWAEFLTGKESLELESPKVKKDTINTLNNMGKKNLENYNYNEARMSIYSDLEDMKSGVQIQDVYKRQT